MNSEQFCYWLNGFVELNPNAMLTLTQWQVIKDHLALVHKKETPFRFPDLGRAPVTTLPFPATTMIC